MNLHTKIIRENLWVCIVLATISLTIASCLIYVNLREMRLDDPLLDCSADGNLSCIQALVKRGADVNFKEGSAGFTPLMMAVGNQQYEAAELLIKLGARKDWPANTNSIELSLSERDPHMKAILSKAKSR